MKLDDYSDVSRKLIAFAYYLTTEIGEQTLNESENTTTANAFLIVFLVTDVVKGTQNRTYSYILPLF